MMRKLLLGAAAIVLSAGTANAGQLYVEGQVGSALEGETGYGGGDFDVEGDVAWGGAVGMTDVFGGMDLELDVLTTDRDYDGFETSLKSTSVLLNGIWDFGGVGSFTPYVGVGLGTINVEYDGANQFPAFSGDEWVFGWQALGGARVNISDTVGLFGEVRYQASEDAEIEGEEVGYNSWSVLFGARLSFGP